MMFKNKKMKSATLILSGFAISPIVATNDFFPLPTDELPYNDDRGQDVTVNCPLSCLNDARCISTGTVGEGFQTKTEWSCECPTGFLGNLCEQQQQQQQDDQQDDEDLCGDDSCKHGSKCIAIAENEHMCDCTAAYTDNTFYAGRFCEFPSTIFCTAEDHQEGRQFCVNDGTCGALDHAPCSCPKGFAGPRCATRVDSDSTAYSSECSLHCMNDGTCHKGEKGMEAYGKFAVDVSHLIQETHINFEHCICPRGYFGVKCEYEFEECGEEGEHSMCLNGGSCEVAQDGSHRCACMDGYYGDGCEYEIPSNVKEQPSHKHSVLRIIGYGSCGVFVVGVVTVAYYELNKRGKDDQSEGSRTVSKDGSAESHVV